MAKTKTVQLRLYENDYTWLTENAVNISALVLGLIQEARRKDEKRPLKERINETKRRLDQAKTTLDYAVRNAWADTSELTGTINYCRKEVERLTAKLAVLQAL